MSLIDVDLAAGSFRAILTSLVRCWVPECDGCRWSRVLNSSFLAGLLSFVVALRVLDVIVIPGWYR